MKPPWPLKPFAVLASFGLLITLPQFIPQWHNWRVYEWRSASSLLDFQPRMREESPVEEELARLRPASPQPGQDPSKIADPHGAMDAFYASLLRTERGEPGAVTRILHYGDSPVTADLITADVRALLQERFGDSGHGAYLIARPWAWYNHRGIDVESGGWRADPATLRKQKDGWYGLGGVSFTGDTGAFSRIRLKRPGHTRLAVSFVAQPGGGELRVLAGDIEAGVLDTSASEPAASQESFDIPPEAQEIDLRVTRGPVRLFQVELFKPNPGIVYDSIGLNGTWAGVLAWHMNGRHWAEQLRRAKPSLVIVNYGTNESGYRNYIDTTYPRDVREIITRIRAAVPEASILIMSPMDRGVREAGGTIGTMPSIPHLVAVQAKLAAENGCAFFNTFDAMGGPGTMGKWYSAEPRLVSADFIHPLPAGGRIVGTLLYNALMDGYNAYKLRLLRQTAAVDRQPGTVRP